MSGGKQVFRVRLAQSVFFLTPAKKKSLGKCGSYVSQSGRSGSLFVKKGKCGSARGCPAKIDSKMGLSLPRDSGPMVGSNCDEPTKPRTCESRRDNRLAAAGEANPLIMRLNKSCKVSNSGGVNTEYTESPMAEPLYNHTTEPSLGRASAAFFLLLYPKNFRQREFDLINRGKQQPVCLPIHSISPLGQGHLTELRREGRRSGRGTIVVAVAP